MSYEKFLASHSGKKIVVCGVGVSNRPLIKLLRRNGCVVEARDRKSPSELGAVAAELQELGVKLITGEEYLENIDADIIYRSPGLHPDALKSAKGYKTSEMEAFIAVCPCKVIAVTGSDGKTTTSTIIAEMLSADSKTVWLGGNIGRPLLDRTPDMSPDDWVVVELSSFQLITMQKAADIAVITNVSPNHLDIHKSLDEYIAAKRNVYAHGDGKVVANLDNAVTRSFGDEAGERTTWFSLTQNADVCYDGSTIFCHGKRVMKVADIRIPGLHNVDNYMAAIAALDGIVGVESMCSVAREFGGVEHRIEFVRELNGVQYYNDSMSSSPTRTVAGLKAFNRKVVLIAGGYDKHIPFDPLVEALPNHVHALVLMGATASKIRAAAERLPSPPSIVDAQNLEQAVLIATEIAAKIGSHKSDTPAIVMFSPACASFDMFANFAERGDVFKRIVNEL